MKVKVSKLLGLVLILIFALSAANEAHAVGVTATVKVGGAPYGVAYDSGRAEIFVVNSSAGTVIVLSDSSLCRAGNGDRGALAVQGHL